MVTTCPHCGAITYEITFRSVIQRRVYDFIRKHPDCVRTEIEDYVWADDPEGGIASNSLSVHLIRMQPILKHHGLRIETRRGPGATYRLVKE